MNPDPALAIYELLQGKPFGTKLITEAVSPLIDGSVLVWLAGECRRMRSTAWIYLRHPKARRRRPPCEINEPWQSAEDSEPCLPLMDYQMVLKLMSRYIPVKNFIGKHVRVGCLAEFFLLEERPLMEMHQPVVGTLVRSKQMHAKVQPKRFWFIEQKADGSFTLKGGWPLKMLKQDPILRQTDLGHDFQTKEALLRHLDELNFCEENNAIIVEGEKVIR